MILRSGLKSFATHPIFLAVALAADGGAVITGMVIADGAPVAGAEVRVLDTVATPPCAATTASDGTFILNCSARGTFVMRASHGDRRSFEIDGVELEPGREVSLNFVLLPSGAVADVPPSSNIIPADPLSFWSRLIPNPTVAHVRGSSITLRIVAAAVAILSFLFGALTMLTLGRHLGALHRRLSDGEVATLVMPSMPAIGETVSPLAVAGARGAGVSVSYGAAEIAALLRQKRYGIVFVALVIAPGLFALFALAFSLAMLIGHELYLLVAMGLVPAGFLLTGAIIGVTAARRASQPDAPLTEKRVDGAASRNA